jgi:tetraacyldisaccharide 4'-kinase
VLADTRFAATLTSAWQRRGVIAWLLAPLALLYALALLIRRRVYALGVLRATRIAAPVLVIGNLYVGGTGKTPLAIELVRALKQRGWTPGVVSRGYGASTGEARIVSPAHTAADVGDEPLLIAGATGAPVAVGADRVLAAELLLRAAPTCDIVVSDDGLQHLALARDLELAVVDERGQGNGWVLPAGPLREPAGRLDSVDAIVLHGNAPAPPSARSFRMKSHLATQAYRLGDSHQLTPLAEFARRQQSGSPKIIAAAGIGVPRRFFEMLRATGLQIEDLPLPDHFDFRDDPFAMTDADVVLITEKDAVKCRLIDALRNDPRIWVVPLEASVEVELVDFIADRLNRLREKPHGSPAA